MENVIQPDPTIGKIEYKAGNNIDFFIISKGEMSIEEINGKILLFISATASHHEIHGEYTVYVEDLHFSLLLPITSDELENKLELQFPNADSNHPDWEKTICSSFYQFEHLLILNGSILIEKKGELFDVLVNGEVGEGLESNFKYEFNAKFKTKINNRIDRNKNYFLPDD